MCWVWNILRVWRSRRELLWWRYRRILLLLRWLFAWTSIDLFALQRLLGRSKRVFVLRLILYRATDLAGSSAGRLPSEAIRLGL